jgi:HYR domain-containing protein
MLPRPPIVPTLAPARAILLPASFAACGVLLLILYVGLVGCGQLLTIPPDVTPNDHNAVLCSCECESPIDPTAVPAQNLIRAGSDDAVQALNQAVAVTNGTSLTLGQQNTVGLRFQSVGIPAHAHINSAYIQFTAAQSTSDPTALQIHVVDSPNADDFEPPPDLRALTPLGGVIWAPGAWIIGETGANEKTENLKDLLQAIVEKPGYTHNSAVAFIIDGSGRRIAKSLEGSTTNGQPAFLTVEYQPLKITQDVLACGDATKPNDVCSGAVQSNVAAMANTCKVATACTCTPKAIPDKTTFSKVCNDPCPNIPLPADCNPADFAKATAATPGHTPVCVAGSPLGSALFGRQSACDIDESASSVSVRVVDEDGENPHTRGNLARGRIEFAGTPCPGDPCGVGLRHRINIGDIFFNGGVFGSDNTFTDLTGVGESTPGGTAQLNATGAGAFGPGSTAHSTRGHHEEGGETLAFFESNSSPLNVALGGWVSGGACTLQGILFESGQVRINADLHGRLVNQPPTAVAGPDQRVECNQTGGATFTLDGSESFDPDNNVAFFGWFKGSRTGPLVGTLPRIQLDQPVKNTTSYVFKVIDAFGQYDEDVTTVAVVDTTKPSITAPSDRTAECTGPTGTAVDIGKATASDVCDASPDISNNAPQSFALGDTTVIWTATDDSGNVGSATQTVHIVDTTPPDLTVTLSPAVLWPPDHKLVPITASITVRDTCDPNPIVRLISIKSSEADNGLGDGDQPEDIQGAALGTDDRAFLLRSERSGLGSGRVYTVTYEASDHSGNTTRREATVTVPKHQ